MTRTTTAHLFSSVNGVVENPNLFQFDAFGPEEGELMTRAIGPVTDVVIGSTLWKEWSEYWPGTEPEAITMPEEPRNSDLRAAVDRAERVLMVSALSM